MCYPCLRPPHGLSMPAVANHDEQGAALEPNGPRLVHGVHRGQEQRRGAGAAARPPAPRPAPGHTLCGHAIKRPSAGTGPAHGRACAHAQRHPCVCHSQGERTTNVVSHARTRCGEGGCLSPRQGPHTLKPSAFHSPWTAHLRPRASGSFMTSIMTRFFTAGSAIMSESSCGARALPVSAARCMEQHGRLANLRPAQPHALHTVRSDRCCCASLYHKRLCQTSEGAVGDRRACRPAAWAGARRACAHSAVHWPWFW